MTERLQDSAAKAAESHPASPKSVDPASQRKSALSSALRQEIGELGRLFGSVVETFAGTESFDLVETVRGLSAELRSGNTSAGDRLQTLLASLTHQQLTIVIRSFTLFLELANLAEDRHRVRVLKNRDKEDRPRAESIQAAIATLHERGASAEEVQRLVDSVAIELVLTAHPTEAKRRSIRRLLRNIQTTLNDQEGDFSSENRGSAVVDQLLCWLEILWHTDLIRPWRPTVMQEVERGMAFLPVLWQEAPAISKDLRVAVSQYYPSVNVGQHPLVRFGSWIGGDRDGNPFVTPLVTEQTISLMRKVALDAHRATCKRLIGILSLSDRQTEMPTSLASFLRENLERFPEVSAKLEALPPLESYRRCLTVIGWRLDCTAMLQLGVESPADQRKGAYKSAEELRADVKLIADSLDSDGCDRVRIAEIDPWLDQIRVFGFHTACLDIRQHSQLYRDVVNEIWKKTGVHSSPEEITEQERVKLLASTLGQPFPKANWSAPAKETLELFTLLRRIAREFGLAALGAHVVSMTTYASDILTVLWFWRWSECIDGGNPNDSNLYLPISPLFETISDLERAASTLTETLDIPAYREHLKALGNHQTVMIGYSDSTKDGGYLAAQWSLYQAQIELHDVAEKYGVQLTFFHGRGGSLGRGGGPAARSILSLPPKTFTGALRLTEQGEVLAERYDNPRIAHRHLEQVAWSSFMAAAERASTTPQEFIDIMGRLSKASWQAYRELVEQPNFGEYYRAVTPITLVERLPIGSRPAKRKSSDRIEDLRAIPWVFSWTQNRCLLPAWFGIGAAYSAVTATDGNAAKVIAGAYKHWPFFTCAIDNAALALAKSNMHIFRKYCDAAASVEGAEQLSTTIVDEFNSSQQTVLAITGCSELLEDIPWLKHSIQVRNGYVDPLNLVQIEIMARAQQYKAGTDGSLLTDIEHLSSLSVKGIATGMRTTG